MGIRFWLLALWVALGVASGFAQTAAVKPSAAQMAAIEQDVAEIARLYAQRYAIQATRIDSGLTEADQRELAELGRRVQAIEEKYRKDRVLGNLLPELNNRRRELVVAEAGPAWNRLMLEKFPTAERVVADFPDQVKRAAAFAVLFEEFALGRTLRPPRTAELTARDQAYQAGLDAAMAKAKAGGEQSREWKAFEAELRRLMMDPGFKREVLGRYVPLFASYVKAEAASDGKPGEAPMWLFKPLWVSEDQQSYLLVAHVLWAGAGLILLPGALVIPVWWLRRAGRRHDPARVARIQKAGAEAGALPETLQVVELPRGMRVALTVTSGVVVDKEGWVETTTSSYTTPATNDQPARTTTQVHTTKKDRLWVRTVDGKEEAWTVTGDVFPARPGQAVSWVSAILRGGGKTTCLLYNHATGGIFEKGWVAEANRGFWGAFFAAWVWVAAWLGASVYLGKAVGMFVGGELLTSGLMTSALGLLIYTGVVRAVIVGGRNRVWKTRYRPVLMAWLESRGQEISEAVRKG